MPIKSVLSDSKRDGECRWLSGRFPGAQALGIVDKLDLMLATLGGLEMVLTKTDTLSDLGFTYLV